MRKLSLLTLMAVLLVAPMAAQGPSAPVLATGQPFQLQWGAPADTVPAGLEIGYTVYIDGTAATAPIVGTQATFPAFTTEGAHSVGVSAHWRIVDTAKWTCGTGTGPVAPGEVRCSEGPVTTLSLTVAAPGIDTPPGAPLLPRIVIVPSGGGLVVELHGFTTPDGTPVATTVLTLPTIKK